MPHTYVVQVCLARLRDRFRLGALSSACRHLLSRVVGLSSAVEPLLGQSLALLTRLYGEAIYQEAYDGTNPYNVIKGMASIYCFSRVPE